MKIQVASDIHIEKHADGGKSFVESMDPAGADVLVLAGDIGCFYEGQQLFAFFGMLCKKYDQILYLPGNHEFYDWSPEKGARSLKDLQTVFKGQVTVLTSEKVHKVGGHRFFGDTMWFPAKPDNFMYYDMIKDFKQIKDCDPFVYDHNKKFQANAKKLVQEGDVIVTHHLPSIRSSPEEWKTVESYRFFVSPMDDFIADRQPALWIHGHTHNSCDYVADKTRIVCNPFGYPKEGHVYYKENLIIEIS